MDGIKYAFTEQVNLFNVAKKTKELWGILSKDHTDQTSEIIKNSFRFPLKPKGIF